MDIVTKQKRSRMMAGIRSRNTKPEILVRKHLFSIGLRFRLHQKIEGVKPDLVLAKYKTCIFVHGCFWHRHNSCKLASNPRSNIEFWEKKFLSNTSRDKRNLETLENKGWKIGIIWECSVRNGQFLDFDYHEALGNDKYWEVG